jgi:hypothetical protein
MPDTTLGQGAMFDKWIGNTLNSLCDSPRAV